MKTKKLKQIISDNEFRINYGDTDNLHNLPSLNHSTDDYHVEIEIHEHSNEMFCEIWVKDKLADLTEIQLDYIFNTFTDFLEQQIESVKMSFYEHKYL